jgi:hypothetical protein
MTYQSSQSSIVLQLEPGPPGTSELCLRVTPEYRAELADLLQKAGIYGGDVIEHSQTALSVLEVVVGPTGGVTSLGIVINTFLKNHRSRKVTFGSHDELKTIEGYSAKDVDRVIESTLKLHDEWTRRSLEQREQWKLGSSEPTDEP